MTIPAILLSDLEKVPLDRPVTLLMRHSVRFPILDPADTYVVGLTDEGVRLAVELGDILKARFPGGRLMAAPVGRCLATAEAIARGAGWPASPQADERLSHPFIAPAWDLLSQDKLNGHLPEQVPVTLELMLGGEEDKPRLDVMVTHDTILAVLVGCWLREPVLKEYWPGYLEGLFVWKSGDKICARWRGIEYQFSVDLSRVME